MVRVVALFSRRFSHRPITRHLRSSRPDQRIKINMRRTLKVIFREKLSVNLYPQLVLLLDYLNSVRSSCNAGHCECNSRCQ